MKKSYIRPEIAFESFSLDSNFATLVSATCALEAESSQDCGITIAGRTIFVETSQGCKYVSADGAYGVCYYVPTGDNNVFNS